MPAGGARRRAATDELSAVRLQPRAAQGPGREVYADPPAAHLIHSVELWVMSGSWRSCRGWAVGSIGAP